VIPFDHHIRHFSLSKAPTMHQDPDPSASKTFTGDNGFGILGLTRRVHVDGDIFSVQMLEFLSPKQLA
jgi:hypothetical protein